MVRLTSQILLYWFMIPLNCLWTFVSFAVKKPVLWAFPPQDFQDTFEYGMHFPLKNKITPYNIIKWNHSLEDPGVWVVWDQILWPHVDAPHNLFFYILTALPFIVLLYKTVWKVIWIEPSWVGSFTEVQLLLLR